MKNLLLLSCLLLFSCSQKEEADLRLAAGIEGIWTLKMVLSNDHWGAPLYWRDVQSRKQVRFAVGGQYFEKLDGETTFKLAGTYEVVSQEELAIIWAVPAFPEFPSYTFTYYFEPGGYLVLQKKQFEGVVAEKYRLAE